MDLLQFAGLVVGTVRTAYKFLSQYNQPYTQTVPSLIEILKLAI